MDSERRIIKITAITVGVFLILFIAFLLTYKSLALANTFQVFSNISQSIQKTFKNIKIKSSASKPNFQVNNSLTAPLIPIGGTDIDDVSAKTPPPKATPKQQNQNKLTVSTDIDGSKTYPVQYNGLFGYEFYTSKIDGSGSIDIGSASKQTIANLLNTINYPRKLTKNLIFINIDPTLVTSRDKLEIPWGSGGMYLNQPKVGTYQSVYGGSVIALNNLTGYSANTLIHELGHLIGFQMTDAEWTQYYKLRQIPANTSRQSSDWNMSPTEDFAEVYKWIFRQENRYEMISWDVRTQFGYLMPKNDFEMMDSPCYKIEQDLMTAYIKANQKDMFDFIGTNEARNAVQYNAVLQKCRKENNTTDPYFGGLRYVSSVGPQTEKFVKGIVERLR